MPGNADRLVLQQIDPKGRVAESTFEPYWLRVVLKERGFEKEIKRRLDGWEQIKKTRRSKAESDI